VFDPSFGYITYVSAAATTPTSEDVMSVMITYLAMFPVAVAPLSRFVWATLILRPKDDGF